MRERIDERLVELEVEHGFRILYANESGSRAWGFASADSDYDIRFIYVWPHERYLSVSLPPETFDFGVDENALDISGWDLRKALRLFRKSNASVTEWISSPIVYREEVEFMERWRGLVGSVFSPKASAAHYRGLGKNIWAGIASDGQTTAKRYLYVLRAVCAARFVLDRGAPPPVLFSELMGQVDIVPELGRVIDEMVANKATGDEGDGISRSALLDTFIGSSLESIATEVDALDSRVAPAEGLDALFRDGLALNER